MTNICRVKILISVTHVYLYKPHEKHKTTRINKIIFCHSFAPSQYKNAGRPKKSGFLSSKFAFTNQINLSFYSILERSVK